MGLKMSWKGLKMMKGAALAGLGGIRAGLCSTNTEEKGFGGGKFSFQGSKIHCWLFSNFPSEIFNC